MLTSVAEVKISCSYLITSAMVLFMAILFVTMGAAHSDLIYQRDAFLEGEIWRGLTAHMIHCDVEHLVWNILAFTILAAYLEFKSRILLIYSVVAGIIGVTGWLILDHSVTYYCGLSGVLNGLFIVILYQLYHDYKNPLIYGMVIGYALKLILEVSVQASIIMDSSWPSLPLAHIAGAISGVVIIAMIIIRDAQYESEMVLRSLESKIHDQ